jgi:hypothetical protein
MNLVAGVLRELLGLFVEDVGYAGAILAWVAVCAVVIPLLDPPFRGIVLAAGFCAILMIGVHHAAARS